MALRIPDVVALTEDLPQYGLVRGQVGTVVQELESESYEIEFCDDEGRTYASVAVESRRLMLLHHGPVKVA